MKPTRRPKVTGPAASVRVSRFGAAVLIAIVAALGSAPVAAQTHIDRRAALDANAYIRIHNLAGSVTVTGWDRDSLAVTGDIVEPATGEGFFFGAAGDVAKMGVWADDATELGPSTLDVRVPVNARVWIKTATADVRVSGVRGGVDITSVTGSIAVSGNPSELFAETLGGRIDIDAETRAVRARTASGAIVVRGAIRDVIATTVSGNLEIEGDRFERGSFESVDGDILYRGNIGRASALDFTGHSGTIQFALPSDASADFVIGTFYGAFEDRFGVRADSTGTRLKGREYRFTLGNGGGQVTVRNFKGRVLLAGKR